MIGHSEKLQPEGLYSTLEEHEGRIKQVIVFRKNLNKVFNSYHFAPQNKVKCWTTIYLSKILYKVKYI